MGRMSTRASSVAALRPYWVIMALRRVVTVRRGVPGAESVRTISDMAGWEFRA